MKEFQNLFLIYQALLSLFAMASTLSKIRNLGTSSASYYIIIIMLLLLYSVKQKPHNHTW